MPVVKNNTALDVVLDRTALVDETKNSGEMRKQEFWQTAVNNRSLKM